MKHAKRCWKQMGLRALSPEINFSETHHSTDNSVLWVKHSVLLHIYIYPQGISNSLFIFGFDAVLQRANSNSLCKQFITTALHIKTAYKVLESECLMLYMSIQKAEHGWRQNISFIWNHRAEHRAIINIAFILSSIVSLKAKLANSQTDQTTHFQPKLLCTAWTPTAIALIEISELFLPSLSHSPPSPPRTSLACSNHKHGD